MYPIQCAAGFSIPLKGGRFSIVGINATIKDPTAVARIAIVDDPNIKATQGYCLDNLDNTINVLCDFKSVANTVGNIGEVFAEPIKTRYGTSAFFTNLVAGSVCVYRE
jgi:hypothetical protein